MRVIITGATGFIGSELTRRLVCDRAISNVQVIIRPLPGLTSYERIDRLKKHWQLTGTNLTPNHIAKIAVVSADIGSRAYPKDLQPADAMIHLAASTVLGDPIALARRNNLFSTQNALDLARHIPDLARFVHISTAYVAGKQRGQITENMASLEARFHNPYEQSKLEAEACVRSSGLPYTILRPSIVVGRSHDGYAPKMQVLYSAWRAWLSGCLPRAPLNPEGWVDLIPLDYACDAIRVLAIHPQSLRRTLHICAGNQRTRSLDILATACRVFGQKPPKLAPPWIVDYMRRPWLSRYLPHDLRAMIEIMHWHVPYLGMTNRVFDTQSTSPLLAPHGIECPSFSSYGERLFEYLQKTSWGKRPLAMSRSPQLQGDLCSI